MHPSVDWVNNGQNKEDNVESTLLMKLMDESKDNSHEL